MPVVSTTKMTARQCRMLGEDPPGVRLELIDGQIAVGPGLYPEHPHASIWLSSILLNHLVAHDLGQLLGAVDVVFGEYDVRRPDLSYYRQDRVHLIDPDDALQSPPDLCVEIVSATSREIDLEDKFNQYAAGGVEYYWIVDPQDETVDGFELKKGRYRLAGKGSGHDVVRLSPFIDLEIPLAKLWFTETIS